MQQNTSIRSWTDEDLRVAVAINTTFIGICKSLNLSRGSGNVKTVKFHIKRMNLLTNHLLGKAHRETSSPNKIPMAEILVENSSYLNTVHLKNRLLKDGLLKHECYICKIPPVWQEQKLTLQLDHINGIHSDNRIENLRILCPNCHSQTKTFAGLNRSGRYKKVIPTCIDCQTTIFQNSIRCKRCSNFYNKKSKIEWPPARELAEEVMKTSYRAAGKRLNVSDAAVKKYLKRKLGHAPKKHKVSHGGQNKLSLRKH